MRLSEREMLEISKELVRAIEEISKLPNHTLTMILKIVCKLLLPIILSVFILGAFGFYAIYQAYNYDDYPTVSEINNNQIQGNSNELDEE